ncbi:MAG: hypothetical protein EXQ53_02055 [Acidobacteria bacterium]|nr:hypothetical protein [Acidobacteriota bacterium]
MTSPAMTRLGVILGTATYMAPEQARGRVVDKRADIWAFGCVLFEMLTGTRAFDGEDMAETLGAVIHREPAWSELPADTPPYLRTLLRRCLQKDPSSSTHSSRKPRLARSRCSSTGRRCFDDKPAGPLRPSACSGRPEAVEGRGTRSTCVGRVVPTCR